MKNRTFLVLSHDERQVATHNYLLSKGLPAIFYDSSVDNTSLQAYMETVDVIICPTPFAIKDAAEIIKWIKPYQNVFGGKLPFSFVKECEAKGAKVYDLLKNNILADINALYTAEGTIGHIIMSTPFALHGAHCLVTGFGKCGKHISSLLRAMGVYVDILDNNVNAIITARAIGIPSYSSINEINLDKYNIIINTIPHNIFNASHMQNISDACYIYDIASTPFGFDNEAYTCASHMMRLPGIPGKITPLSAGELIGKIVLSLVE